MPMTPGVACAVVIEHSFYESSKGTPGVAVLFQIKGLPAGEHDRIIGHIWLTEAAAGLARKSLRAIGFDPDSQKLEELNENPTLLAGKETTVILAENENDSRFMQVKYIGSQGIAPLASAKAKQIGSAGDALIRGAKGQESAPKKRKFEDEPTF